MIGLKYSTPYTPIFPDPVDELVEEGSSSSNESTDTIIPQNPYMEVLKERYLSLASLPEVLCPPSREPSPESEARILSIRQRIYQTREKKGFLPELVLTCVRLKGGDWAPDSAADENDNDNDIAFVFHERVLPETDEEWFELQRILDDRRAKRKAERLASERWEQVVQWVDQVQAKQSIELALHQGFKNQESEQSQESSPNDPGDPVDRVTSPPPAPKLDVLESFSAPNSQAVDYFIPRVNLDEERPLPALPDCNNAMARSMESIHNVPPQLSSPVSPPRSLQPLKSSAETQLSFPVSSKRNRDSFDQDHDDAEISRPLTPTKRPKTGIEPITPMSVEKRSQERRYSQDIRHRQEASSALQEIELPPMIDLLEHQRPQKRSEATPASPRHQSPNPSTNIEFSQPSYSRFHPQFESTQHCNEERGSSPGIETSLLNMPPSSGAALYYQSQFNMEQNVERIDEVLRRDVEIFSTDLNQS